MPTPVSLANPQGGGFITVDLDNPEQLAAYRAMVNPEPTKLLRLDLGCGKSKRKPDTVNGKELAWTGVDAIKFEGVDVVADLTKPWPWKDGEVEEIHCSQFVEHLKRRERVHFANEACRVLKKGGKATIITPYWGSMRAYGDMTHEWPPVSEFWFPYLDKEWRKVNAPHDDAEHNPEGYTCDFTYSYGYALGATMVGRSQEYVGFALTHYREAASDLIATLTKK